MAQDQAYPWASNPRQFVAVAMPNGDARFGVAGPLVFLSEKRGPASSSEAVGRSGGTDKLKYLSRAEAEQLRDELDSALRSFGIASAMAEHFADRDRPSAARGPYPFRDHRTLADCPPRKEAPALAGDDRR
jgi:hypothetical protein